MLEKIQQVSSKITYDEEHKFPWCSEATNSNISVTKVINLVGKSVIISQIS